LLGTTKRVHLHLEKGDEKYFSCRYCETLIQYFEPCALGDSPNQAISPAANIQFRQDFITLLLSHRSGKLRK
jgi:hypothetical protein